MNHPVESASPSRAAGIQQGEDEAESRASRDRWIFYEAVKIASGGDFCYMTRNMMIQGRGFV
jgi:hypothetical protein